MRIFIIILIVISALMVVYNAVQIDFNDPLGEDSIIGAITALAGLCAILVLAILYTSKKIQDKSRGK